MKIVEMIKRFFGINKEEVELKTFYGTFGVNSSNKNYYQPIIARNREAAHKAMMAMYKYDWSSIYSEEEWENEIKEHYSPEGELPKLLTSY